MIMNQSSNRAYSMDFPDPLSLSLSVPISHHSHQVPQIAPCARRALRKISSYWSAKIGTSMC